MEEKEKFMSKVKLVMFVFTTFEVFRKKMSGITMGDFARMMGMSESTVGYYCSLAREIIKVVQQPLSDEREIAELKEQMERIEGQHTT